MADHPYNIGDEVLIRGTVIDFSGSEGQWVAVNPSTINPIDLDGSFEVHCSSITQSTPTEPRNEKSVVLDRYGFTWQRIAGLWQQGDVAHEWAYLLDHVGPVKVIYRGEP